MKTIIQQILVALCFLLSASILKAQEFDQMTTNPADAAKIKAALISYLAKDLSLLTPKDRNYSFYKIDLNSDNKPEYLVSLSGEYFCGRGGCTFLLFNNAMKLMNRFTVMKPPVFRSSQKTAGWNNLIIRTPNTTFIHLKYNPATKKYPSNPSMIKPNNIAPGGSEIIMWDDNFSKAKPFKF